MKNGIKLTNCYRQRKQTHDTFTEQCRDIVSHLRRNREQGSGIDVLAQPITVEPDDPNMLCKLIVVMSTAASKYMLIKIQCNRKIYYWTYELPMPPVFRTAEELVRSRFHDRNMRNLSNKRAIELEKFSENPFYVLDPSEAVA